jgi:hypothetical protein
MYMRCMVTQGAWGPDGQRGPVVGDLAEPPLRSGGAGLAARVDTPAGRARVSRLYIFHSYVSIRRQVREPGPPGERAL